MKLYLLYGLNNGLHTFITALELYSIFSTLGAKLSKISNFHSSVWTSDSISKLNPTCQHESKGMLGFQNRALDTKLLQFHVNRDEWAYLEKHDFQRKFVVKSDTTIRFVASKRVREWSQFLISSPRWLYTQNEAKIKLTIYRLSRKT